MAEFCLDCLNKYYKDKKLTEEDVILDEDFCEECGEWKPCVIKIKREEQHKLYGTKKRKWYQFWRR